MKDDLGFQFWLARWFGEPISQTDGAFTVTGFMWRGQLFITGFSTASKPPDLPRSP